MNYAYDALNINIFTTKHTPMKIKLHMQCKDQSKQLVTEIKEDIWEKKGTNQGM